MTSLRHFNRWMSWSFAKVHQNVRKLLITRDLISLSVVSIAWWIYSNTLWMHFVLQNMLSDRSVWFADQCLKSSLLRFLALGHHQLVRTLSAQFRIGAGEHTNSKQNVLTFVYMFDTCAEETNSSSFKKNFFRAHRMAGFLKRVGWMVPAKLLRSFAHLPHLTCDFSCFDSDNCNKLSVYEHEYGSNYLYLNTK